MQRHMSYHLLFKYLSLVRPMGFFLHGKLLASHDRTRVCLCNDGTGASRPRAEIGAQGCRLVESGEGKNWSKE